MYTSVTECQLVNSNAETEECEVCSQKYSSGDIHQRKKGSNQTKMMLTKAKKL